MPITPSDKVTQLDAAFNFTPILCLITGDLASITITADSSTDTFTASSHGLANGTPLFITSTGSVPNGINAGTLYFAIAVTTNTFQLATTPGGSAVDFTSNGSGVMTATEQAIADYLRYYDDGDMVWDVLVRHEVTSYNGDARKSFTWPSATLNSNNGRAELSAVNVSIIPTTAAISFQYAVVIRGGNTTRGDATGAAAIIENLGSSTIGLQGYTFTFTSISL